jgi:hypothetical protein
MWISSWTSAFPSYVERNIQENVMKQLAILRDGVAMLLATVMLVSSASAQTSAPKGQSETIKVHGHWTIVVKNPDGSVASHREFENALFQGDGDVVLAAILSRTSSTGMWAIELDGPTAAKPCHNGTSGVQCEILEPNGNLISGEEAFENLTMQLAGTPKAQVILSGTAKSINGGQINLVSTFIGICNASVLPSSCGRYGSGIHRLTMHTLTPPMTIVASQSINVTVTLSFS